MPFDLSRLRGLITGQPDDDMEARKKKRPVGTTPPIAPPGTTAAAPPVPNLNPSLSSARTPEFNPQPKMQPVGNVEAANTAAAPRYDQLDPNLIGGGKLQSEEELKHLREKGMVRPNNDFGFKERLGSAVKTALAGGLRGAATGGIGGALGGAAAGAAGGAYDPRKGARMEFETFQQPGIDREKARQQQEEDRRRALAGQDRQAAIQEGQIAKQQAELGNMPSPEEARMDRELQQMDRQSQINLRNAQAEAERTGIPKRAQLDDGSGQIWEVDIYPGGRQDWLGLSGSAEIKEADRASREKIATDRNTAAMQRTQATQGAITARQKAGGAKGGKKYVSITDIREYAKKHGISESQATAKAKQEGFTPVR